MAITYTTKDPEIRAAIAKYEAEREKQCRALSQVDREDIAMEQAIDEAYSQD